MGLYDVARNSLIDGPSGAFTRALQQIVVSPADARTVVFPTMTDATTVWVKVRALSVGSSVGCRGCACACVCA